MTRKITAYLAALICLPLLVLLGVFLFDDRRYDIISIMAAFVACIPFFASFEKRRPNTKELVLISVMVALSVAGRFAFAFVPAFKPVTAIVIICGICFGESAGFITGALSAVVSNIYFGQGPWTPFQMMTWGLIGFFAGIFSKKECFKNKAFIAVFGIVSGIIYSLVMDIWTIFSISGEFSWERYLAAVLTSIPYMFVYALSNVVFLLVLEKPIGRKLLRVKKKFGLFNE